MKRKLVDSFGREFVYLRLSLIDACNFRCVYCLPDGYKKNPSSPKPLNVNEINRLAAAFSEMGFTKIRLTGGEPTLRKELCEIARLVGSHHGIETLALTTNGFRLKHQAAELLDAGITSLNVSIDSLDPKEFEKITGQNRLGDILEGVDAALRAGFRWVKVNAGLLKGFSEKSLQSYIDWMKDKPISVRFIELMQTGENSEYFNETFVSSTHLRKVLLEKGWNVAPRKFAAGPAEVFFHPESLGQIGLIAPYSSGFCQTCNRLRVDSYGNLKLCLFGDGDISLRHLLQSDRDKEELIELVCSSVLDRKKETHLLSIGNTGATQNFSTIGG